MNTRTFALNQNLSGAEYLHNLENKVLTLINELENRGRKTNLYNLKLAELGACRQDYVGMVDKFTF